MTPTTTATDGKQNGINDRCGGVWLDGRQIRQCIETKNGECLGAAIGPTVDSDKDNDRTGQRIEATNRCGAMLVEQMEQMTGRKDEGGGMVGRMRQ